MKLKIGKQEFSVKFGYEPTLKEHLISRFVKFTNMKSDDDSVDFDKIEDLLLFLPEILLIGLQVHHKDYRYNYDTGEGKAEQLEKAFALVDEYANGDDADIMEFFKQMQEALLQDGFLRSLFNREQKKIEETEDAAQTTEKNLES